MKGAEPHDQDYPLLERNEQFASTYTPAPLGPPTAQVLIVTCLDHRVDPAITLGLWLGDASVIRNAGGRVTQAVIDDLAYLAEQLFGGQDADDRLFEVAVVHHTQCGTGLLADPSFRHQAAQATGLPEAVLEASAVEDPHSTVKADVGRLLTSPLLSPKISAPATCTTSPPDALPPPSTPGTRSGLARGTATGSRLARRATRRPPKPPRGQAMPYIKTADRTSLFVTDWGNGPPVVTLDFDISLRLLVSASGPLEVGRPVPQTALIPIVTRHYSSGLVNFRGAFE